MTTSTPALAAATRAHPLAVLTALATRGHELELVPKSDGSRALRVSKGGAAVLGQRDVIYSAFTIARELGWLTDLDATGMRWGLSQEGRVALRRLRSEGGGAIQVEVTAAREALPELMGQTCVNAAESPLAWLRRRKHKGGEPLISAMQFDAGERLRGDLWFAQMSPRVTANWSAAGGGSSKSGGGLGIDIRDNVAAAQQRVRRALSAVSPVSAGLLLDVCGHLLGLEQIERSHGWPPRSGKVMLRNALDELARHYGLPGADTMPAKLASRLRHWGVDDYRPCVDAAG